MQVRNHRMLAATILAFPLFGVSLISAQSSGSTSPLSNTVNTPRPFDPGQNTTNPSAFAVQNQNPFLGSVPTGAVVPGVLPLSLRAAVSLALKANLGYIDSEQDHIQTRAARVRALSQLLPQLSAETTQTFRNLISDSLGVEKLGFPHEIDMFNYQGAHINYKQDVFDLSVFHEVKARTQEVAASTASVADAKNIVVLASVSSYLLVAASQTRVETAKAEFATATITDLLLQSRVRQGVSPDIDQLRAQVSKHSAEQRLAIARISFEKEKLALTRIIGLPVEQQFSLTDPLDYHAAPDQSLEVRIALALNQRQDLKAAQARVEAAKQLLSAQKAQRLPTLGAAANAGETGVTYGHAFGDYEVEGRISLPLFTGRRIQSEITTAEATLLRRNAELADVTARAVYDVRTAALDLEAGETSVRVAMENQVLATEGLRQATDRFQVGVSNTVDLIQAQQAVAEAEDNRIASIYAHSLAKLMLIRATGTAEQDYVVFLGVK